MPLHLRQEAVVDRQRRLIILRRGELRDQPAGRRAIAHLAGGFRQPFLHLRRRQRLFRQPVAARRVAFHQIHQDGVAVGQRQFAVLQHRDLAERIEAAKRRALAHRRRGLDPFIGQVEHAQQQRHAVGVAGKWRAVQLDGGHNVSPRSFSNSILLHSVT